MTTYQNYLVLDMLTKRLQGLGLTIQYAMLHTDFDGRGTTGTAVDIAINYEDSSGKWMRDEEREAKLNEFLALYPQTTVERTSEYGGKPDMKALGVTNLGIAWEINFHAGTCERVQVGTKVEEQFDPEALANLTRIPVEVPVYEYLCPDPIVTAGLIGRAS